MYHFFGPLNPPSNKDPVYSQFYIFDGNEAKDQIKKSKLCNDKLDDKNLSLIQTVLEQNNPFAHAYRHMKDIEQDEQDIAASEGRIPANIKMFFHEKNPRNRRQNAPRHEEVAAIFTGEDGAPPQRQYVVVESFSNNLKIINDLCPSIDPLCYPILFPNGDNGFFLNMKHTEQNKTKKRTNVTLREFFQHRFSERNGDFNPIFHSGPLFQQYLIDAYVRMESNNLFFIRQNQSKLRVDNYKTLHEYIQKKQDQLPAADPPSTGTPIVLPSSYDGSPRSQRMRYQDAMSVVAKYGRPDLFITMTCNPKWPEIVKNLKPGQHFLDAPHLTTRVFNMYKKQLLKELWQDGVLGKCDSKISVIEFQKRGLPHCHILIHLKKEDKIENLEEVDKLISAEIPDRLNTPLLFATVKNAMLHGPCGKDNPQCACMITVKEGSECSKKFPKHFSNHTHIDGDGFPSYRRRNLPGNAILKIVPGRKPATVDNRNVVPYNPYLCQKFNCHINVESCHNIKAVKYLYKYVHKGHDEGALCFEKYDEIKRYVDGRYVCATEAYWRIIALPLHDSSHSVQRLAVHLPNQQPVFFEDGEEEAAIENIRDTKLTAFFEINKQNIHNTRHLTYPEIIHDYIFEKGVWRKRKKNWNKQIISRLYNVSPRDTERYHLRILLLHVKGPTSFENLRTVNKQLFPTFKEACVALGLVIDDTQNYVTMHETVSFASAKQSRRTFSYLLLFCDVVNAKALWNTFLPNLCEDFIYKGVDPHTSEGNALFEIQNVLMNHGRNLTTYGLPNKVVPFTVQNEEPHQNIEKNLDELTNSLNNDQRTAANNILHSLNESIKNKFNQNPKEIESLFFVDGPGGSGKTYLYNYLIKVCKSKNIQISCSAWVGVAATLLENGGTCHSVFKLPVPCIDGSKCNVAPSSDYGLHIRNINIVIVDEISMMNRYAFDAIDKMLRDVCKNELLFGGKIMVFGGDFRQTLPIVKHGSIDDIVNQCVVTSKLWPSCKRFELSKNMRAKSDAQSFSNFLLQVGSNKIEQCKIEPYVDCIQIPSQCIIEKQKEENQLDLLITKIFPKSAMQEQIQKSVILTPTNKSSLMINDKILNQMSGELVQCFSSDEAILEENTDPNMYPIDFLNSITTGGLPPHTLNLKIGCIVMLLKNLDIKSGLTNGTRLVVRKILNNLIVAEILSGAYVGNIHFIPKVFFQPSDADLPFTLKRYQFPFRLAYSMTINKSQGQTFSSVGIFLDKSCFSHGQLYVALSRGRSFDNISILIFPQRNQGYIDDKYYTRNIVYQRVLDLCKSSAEPFITNGSENVLNEIEPQIYCSPMKIGTPLNESPMKIGTPTKYAINLSSKFSSSQKHSPFTSPFIDFEIDAEINSSHLIGIKNMGNTCYANSIIQLLRCLSDLYHWDLCQSLSSRLTESFKRLMVSMNTFTQNDREGDEGRMVRPIDFLGKLRGVMGDHFNIHQQHDVPEVLQTILNDFIDCNFVSASVLTLRCVQDTTCSVCGSVKNQNVSFSLIPVPIATNLQQCFEDFCKPISLKGDNQYQCDTCDGRQNAVQSNSIANNPNFLFIQIRRAKDGPHGHFVKDTSDILLNETLTLLCCPNQSLEYTLRGTIHHVGEVHQGHYTACVNVDNFWYLCDDSTIVPIEFDSIDCTSVYLAVYKLI